MSNHSSAKGDNDSGKAVRSQSTMVSDSAIVAATGRSRDDWFAMLDGAGAREWDHAQIARWLGAKHEVDGWWAQGVTVSYEQSRGLREPGQRPDGSFDVSSSKTLQVDTEALWPHLTEEDKRRAWLDLELNQRSASAKSIRFDGGEGTRVAFSVDAQPATKSGVPRCKMSIQHSRLSREAVTETKEFWKDALTRLVEVLKTETESK
ncbi:molybdopterin-binding protein [Flaviflexus massiliensis]|uniref:hypothetical protein n=1 Tax=Flaviflexus massiliensis TaxID=1522309 RepID=UPI0006D55D59|nr:hypothetical protein [Flaviflexus massiliensis]